MPAHSSRRVPLHLDCEQLDPRHLDMRITSINLIVNYHKQGDCDERVELLYPDLPREVIPKANHFSYTFGFEEDGYEEVVLDVIPSEVERFRVPVIATDDRLARDALPAMVRVRSIPKMHIERFSGHIYRELRVRRWLTMQDILGLISKKGRLRYAFKRQKRQKSGCRHWIRVLADDMEEAGFTGRYFVMDIYGLMGRYYERGFNGDVVEVEGERVGELERGQYYNVYGEEYIRLI